MTQREVANCHGPPPKPKTIHCAVSVAAAVPLLILGCQGVSPLCFLNSIALFISRSRRISNEISLDYMCKKHLEGQRSKT